MKNKNIIEINTDINDAFDRIKWDILDYKINYAGNTTYSSDEDLELIYQTLNKLKELEIKIVKMIKNA